MPAAPILTHPTDTSVFSVFRVPQRTSMGERGQDSGLRGVHVHPTQDNIFNAYRAGVVRLLKVTHLDIPLHDLSL